MSSTALTVAVTTRPLRRRRVPVGLVLVGSLLVAVTVVLLCRPAKLSAAEEDIYEAVFRYELDRFKVGGYQVRLHVKNRRLSSDFLARFASYPFPVPEATWLEKSDLADTLDSWVPALRRRAATSPVVLLRVGTPHHREDGAIEVWRTVSYDGRFSEGSVYTLANRSGRWVVTKVTCHMAAC